MIDNTGQTNDKKWLSLLLLAITLYFFLYSIKLLGHSFKLFGKDFAETLLSTTSNPFMGLFIGILATSIIQSSSTTTSIVVSLVAVGSLTLENAIPMVMGANIGTTVTNILVSLGHATRRAEFQRAFSAAIVHDLFNVFSVLVLFPIEITFHPIQKFAALMSNGFVGIGGMTLFNPVKFIISPMINLTDNLLGGLPYAAIVMAILSLVVLFLSLAQMVKSVRGLALGKIEQVIDKYLFGKDLSSMLLGAGVTAIVQSSSVTTSLIVPLAGAGVLTTKQVFPFTLGANVGTTVTAIIAALSTSHPIAVTVAFAHLTFNIFGIVIFYPLKFLPINLANKIGAFAGRSQKNVFIVIAVFILIYLAPILIVAL